MPHIVIVVDKHISWIHSRRIFCFAPLLLQSILMVALPSIHNTYGVIAISIAMTLLNCTAFAGSIYALAYELDPANSATIVSIFNGCGQISGFVAPLLRERITSTDLLEPLYDMIYRERWNTYFYVSAVIPLIGILAVLTSQVFRKSEWVNRAV